MRSFGFPAALCIALSLACGAYARAAGEPTRLTSSGGVVWYTDSGRNALGRMYANGAIREFALPPGGQPELIIPDGSGGVWFSRRGDPRPWHSDSHAALSVRAIGAPPYSWIERMLPDRDGSIVVVESGGTARSLYRATKEINTRITDIPAQPRLDMPSIAPDGSVWFNIENQTQVARLDGSLLTVVTMPNVFMRGHSPGPPFFQVSRAQDVFFEIARIGDCRGAWDRGISLASSGGYPGAPFEAAGDGNGGGWVSDCALQMVVHIPVSLGSHHYFPQPDCPRDLVSDGARGVWFLRDRTQTIVHIDGGGNVATYPIRDPDGDVGSLGVDGAGTLWFVERAANRIGFIRKGSVHEVALGDGSESR